MISERGAPTLALAIPGVEERSHQGAAAFNVRGTIFATVPGPDRLVVRIEPASQDVLVAAEPGTFSLATAPEVRAERRYLTRPRAAIGQTATT